MQTYLGAYSPAIFVRSVSADLCHVLVGIQLFALGCFCPAQEGNGPG